MALTSVRVSYGIVPPRIHVETWRTGCETISRGDHICERYRGCKSPRRASESSQVDHYARCSRNFVFPFRSTLGAHFVLRRAGETRGIHWRFPGVPLYIHSTVLPNYPTEYRARSRTLFPSLLIYRYY